MPHQLATLICLLIVIYLFRVDLKQSSGHSRALWIPQIWMLLGASRPIARWFGPNGSMASPDAYLDGSPMDRAVFFVLIIMGIVVLHVRRINWRDLIAGNMWIWAFFIFGVASILWSDYPFLSLKRWIKAFGNIIMALVVLTEERPYEAIGVLLRRMGIIFVPISILLIKYYPDIGRGYHMGLPMYTGIADQKNGLGQICLMSGVYFCWAVCLKDRALNSISARTPLPLLFLLVPMLAWLFYMANSATAIGCMALAGILCILGRLPIAYAKPRRIPIVLLASVLLIGVMDWLFEVKAAVVTFLGRDSGLTTRVPMWESLLSMAENPIIGFGFESFWTGERRAIVQEMWGGLIQAHNGYLETYLNLGLVGVIFVLGWFLSGLRSVNRSLVNDYPNSMFRLCFILVIAVYNWTEATFYGASSMWVLLLLCVFDLQPVRKHSPI